jgi:hypothetical protein
MSTGITDAKLEFKSDLTELGFDVFEYVPERLNPPTVVITGNSNYVSVADLTNDYKLGLDLVVIAGVADNDYTTEQLDNLLATLLKGMPNYAVINSVGAPSALAANNADYLTVTVGVDLYISL